jgi:HAD superfamily hydrolase (TIGR01490 family)
LKKRIAFFDFDGTITQKDTLLEFIKYSKGELGFYFGFLINSPYLIAYKLKIISNQKAKEKVLRFFFRRTPLEQFQQQCNDFTENKLPDLIRPKATEEIKKLQSIGAELVIVSASPQNWIAAWAESLQLKLIATRLEIRNQKITGKIEGLNCHGEEKVRRIKELYSLADYDEIYTYGDSKGDRPMLQLGTASFFRPFL